MTTLDVPALLLVALAPALRAQEGNRTEAGLEAVRESVANAREQLRVLGLSVAVARGGRLQLAEGFGSLDVDGKVPATADTRYRVASVTKPITAVAVLQLAAQGKLGLDDKACERCPAYPSKPADPTIRHLLAHQSGIRHTNDEEDTTTRGAFEKLAQAIAPIAGEPLAFEPGERMLYSSWGYAVLGCVIETVSEQSYAAYVAEHVLAPAGMKATGFDRPDLAAPDFSPGYRLVDGRFEPSEVVDTRFKTPASGLVSTAPDLVRFALALQGDALLPKEWSVKLFEPQPLRDGSIPMHTLGWLRLSGSTEPPAYFYGGNMEGTTALLLVVPERGDAVAILANRERFAQQLFPLMLQIRAALAR